MKEIYVRTKLVNGTYVYAPKGTKDTYGTVLIDNDTLKYYNDVNDKDKSKLKVNGAALIDNYTLISENGKLKVDATVINNQINEELLKEIDKKLDKGPIPAKYLPSYVDDVVEYDSKDAFPLEGEIGKIYVDKSTNLTYRWSGSTYIMVGGGDLNIENGTGIDSLVQKYSGEVDATHFGNTCNGESAAVFGEANFDSGNRTLISGKMNRNSAPNSLIIGLGNGRGIGANPTIDALSGEQLFVFGVENSISNGDGNAVLGNENTLSDVRYTTIIGRGNIINNTSMYEGKCVVGRYNNQKRDTMFEVGVGDYNNRVNGLEVLKDGRAKVQSAPIESNDVLRLNEFSVLTQEQVDLLF